MKLSLTPIFALGISVFLAGTAQSQEVEVETEPTSTLALWQADHSLFFDAEQIDLAEFVWIARPLVVFADSPNDPQFRQQVELLQARIDELAERDILLITDTAPATPSAVRTALRPRGFMLALIDKDGRVALRKPSPWDVRELTRSIDKTPLRQQEVDERRALQP